MNPMIPDDVITIPGFNIIRRDRANHGGGIIFYINSSIPHSAPSFSSSFEYMWIKLPSDDYDINICLAYRPPSASQNLMESILDDIINISSGNCNNHFIICGDFNVPGVDWLKQEFPKDPIGQALENLCSTALLKQCVLDPTRLAPRGGMSLLDLILVDNYIKTAVSLQPPLGSSDHTLITCTMDLVCSLPFSVPRVRKLFHLANWDKINKAISDNILLATGAVFTDDAALLTSCINSAVEKFVPTKIIIPGKGKKIWFDQQCENAWINKKDAFNNFLDNPSLNNWATFKEASKKCNNTVNRAKQDHQYRSRHLFSNLKSKPGAWWHALKIATGKGKKSGTPAIRYNNCLVSNPLDKANIICSAFVTSTADIHEKQLFSKVPDLLPITPNFEFTTSTPSIAEVRSRLDSINSETSAGPDLLGPIPLLRCKENIVLSLHKVISKSWSSATFPTIWKNANVVPIPKIKPPSSPEDFRPISLTSLMSKITEECMEERLLTFLEDNKVISESQFGFRKGYSSLAPILLICQKAANYMDSCMNYCLVTLDFQRAFDNVWHAGLINKLTAIGIPSGIIAWFCSYLKDRTFNVVIEGAVSHTECVKGGVPQGSVLGPTLFSIFINDLLESLQCDVFCYADDLAIATAIPSMNCERSISAIQADLNSVCNWSDKWLLPLNPTKCNYIVFSASRVVSDINLLVYDQSLTRMDQISYLGVTLCSNLSWAPHISKIKARANRQLGALIYSTPLLSRDAAVIFYKAYVRSNLEYCAPLWAGAPKSVLLQCDSVQSRAIKVLGDIEALSLSLQSLHIRRLVGGLTYLHAIIHKRAPSKLQEICPSFSIPDERTRLGKDCKRLTVSFSRTNRHMNSYMPYFSRAWNQLPLDLRSISEQHLFKRSVNDFLKRHPPK